MDNVEGPEISFKKGETYKRMGLLNEAIAEFEKALTDEQLKYRASRAISLCLLELNRTDEAERVLVHALFASEIPNYDRLWIYSDLADIYAGMNKYESALERLYQIKTEDPSFFADLDERIEHLENKMKARHSDSGVYELTESGGDGDNGDEEASEIDEDLLKHSDPRRKAPRFKLSNPVHYSFDQIVWSTGYYSDISRTGMFILTYEPVPVGSVVFLKFQLPNSRAQQAYELVGQAVRQENKLQDRQGVLGMGVHFVSMESEVREGFERSLKKLVADGTAELDVPAAKEKIRFHCDLCGKIISAPRSYAGKMGKCSCGHTMPVPVIKHTPTEGNPLKGFLIAGCRIDRIIGKGSAATVYKGHHLALDIPVAIKILHPGQQRIQSEMARRFLKEASVIAKLNHANIVGVMNAGEEKGHNFIVMQYVPGQSLGKAIQKREAVSINDFIRIFLDVCKALTAAHEFGVIHGDIKPDNILLTPGGRAMLADFGLVRDLRDVKTERDANVVVGTPLYMSPEQAKGEYSADVRSDLYSLGAAMYHTLAGHPPFQAFTVAEVIRKHLREPLTPLTKINPKIPESVSNIVTKAMAKRPENRYQTAEDLKQEFLRLTGELAFHQLKPLSKKLGKRMMQNWARTGQ